jgi:methylated-DNA-[protein]-cysteine S-methyltransferase
MMIQWIESCSGAKEFITLLTPAGYLQLMIRLDVICQAVWLLKTDDTLPIYHHHPVLQGLDLKENPPFAVKLLMQGSSFRQLVWTELGKIPYGTTLSYSALAAKIGSSARAVGNACRDNPYPFLIPCHRVVSISGLGGYCGQTAGDFMQIKAKLLQAEASFIHDQS